MININEDRIRKIVREKIEEVMVKNFTPYTEKEAEQNRKAIYHPSNPSWDAFKKWRDEKLANGVPSREASYNNYRKEIGLD